MRSRSFLLTRDITPARSAGFSASRARNAFFYYINNYLRGVGPSRIVARGTADAKHAGGEERNAQLLVYLSYSECTLNASPKRYFRRAARVVPIAVCVPGRMVERGFTVIIGQFANAVPGTRLSPGVVNDRRRSVDSSSRCATMRAAYASQHPIMHFFPRAARVQQEFLD